MLLRSAPWFAVAACVGSPLAWPVPRIEVAPEAAAFPSARVGDTNLVALDVVNTGTDDVRLTASVALPFRVAADRLDVPAGSSRLLLLSWAPEDYADAAASLTLTGPLTDLAIPVSGSVDPDVDGDGDPAEAAGGGDCDDRDAAVGGGAVEVCDGRDNDCDGATDDDALDARAWYPDDDGDGWGRAEDGVTACDSPGPDWATRAGDCDDGDDAVNPAAVEVWYDGVDGDCSGGSDDDRDADGFDNEGTGGDDCQDEDPDVNPGAAEVAANGVDDDCDGATDEPV